MRWVRQLTAALTLSAVAGGTGIWVYSKTSDAVVTNAVSLHAYLRDGSGLPAGTRIVIAGISVGEVTKLTIVGERARLDLQLRNDVAIWSDAWLIKRASSPLGDNYLEILPGGPAADEPSTATQLASGQELTQVVEAPGTDRFLRTVASTTPKLVDTADRAAAFIARTRADVTDGLESRLRSMDGFLTKYPDGFLGRVAKEVQQAEDWSRLADDDTAGLAATIQERLDSFRSGLARGRTRLAEAQQEVRDGFASARAGLDQIDPAVDKALAALQRRSGGDEPAGTLQRLIHDEELGERIDDSTRAAASALAIDRFQSWLGFRAEFNIGAGQPRFYMIADLSTRGDKFYLVELEKGPLGAEPEVVLTSQPGSTSLGRAIRIREGIRFTAQFGKRFGRWRIRAGIKESFFGAGTDLDLFGGHLRVSADLFESAFSRTPRLKLGGALHIFRQLYVLAGVDDALNPSRNLPIGAWPADQSVPIQFTQLRYGRDYYAGAMVSINDADLSALLRVYGALIAGLF